ncbi:MAG: hypothetical protein PVG06_00940 [Desulfobacterales bacterium]|jgi:hypothetical protein
MRSFKYGVWFLTLSLLACQGVQRTVAPEDRISLHQGGPHTGIWESKAILLEYQYDNLSGELKLNVRAKVKTEVRYDGIKVYLLFVDAQGRVLERKEVAGYRLGNTFEIPSETTFISFQANTFRRPVIYSPPNYR